MRGSMRKIVSMLLIAVMLLAFVGCGNSKSGDKEKFVGTWNATLDMTDVLNESLREGIAEEDETMADYFSVDKFDFVVEFTFNEDGTYSTTVDEASLNRSSDALKASVKDGLMRYFEDMVAEMDLDMSVEDLLDLSGRSIDALLDEALPTDLFDDVLDEFRLKGNWKAENGKLHTTESVDESIDKNAYELYEFTSNGDIKLSLVDDSEDESGVFPMILKKVN